ncbi:NUDIX domain-containing protein [candidate division KSB1 bacterium]|nr:NUDIX domain-containing protein [candidate division KSB1 bacterium]
MKGRAYPEHPMIGVGAVVFNRNNQVLLVQRGNQPSAGLWALPGGLVELGEELKNACTREIMEECNIEVRIGDVIDVLDLILKDENGAVQYHYILVDYEANYLNGDLSADTDANDAAWFSHEEIEALDIPEATRLVLNKAIQKRKSG